MEKTSQGRRLKLSDKVLTNYDSSRNLHLLTNGDNFDSSNVVKNLSALTYAKGYSFSKRIDKIGEYLASVDSNLAFNETGSSISQLNIFENHVDRLARTKRGVKDYEQVKAKIENIRNSMLSGDYGSSYMVPVETVSRRNNIVHVAPIQTPGLDGLVSKSGGMKLKTHRKFAQIAASGIKTMLTIAGAVIIGAASYYVGSKVSNQHNQEALDRIRLTLTESQDNYSAATNSLANARNEINALNASNSNLTHQAESANSKIVSLENKFEAMSTAMSNQVYSSSTTISNLNNNLNELKSTVASLAVIEHKYNVLTNEIHNAGIDTIVPSDDNQKGIMSSGKEKKKHHFQSATPTKGAWHGFGSVVKTQNSTNNLSNGGFDSVVDSNVSTNNPNLVQRIVSDVDQYRVHAVKKGSREVWPSFERAGNETRYGFNEIVDGVSFSSGVNADKRLREDDFSFKKAGKRFGDEVGKNSVSFAKRILGPLTDEKDAYKGVNFLTALPTYFGRLINGAKTEVISLAVNIPNTALGGVINNAAQPILNAPDHFVEGIVSSGQGVLNTPRYAFKPLPSKSEEVANKVQDWIGLVPFRFAGNVLEGQGFSNAENIQQSIADKGHTGVFIESFAGAYLLENTINNAINNPEHNNSITGENDGGEGAGHITGEIIGGEGAGH